MAVLNKSVIGSITGKLGNIVIKNRNGKKIVYVMPRKYKASKSPKAIEGKNNFAASVRLAKAVNSVPALKEIWANSKAEGTNSFQKIIKNNLKLVKEGSLTEKNEITPDGLPLKLISTSVGDNKIHLSLGFTQNKYLVFPALLIIYFFFNMAEKKLVNLSHIIESLSADNVLSIDLVPDGSLKKIIKQDSHPIIFSAIAGENSFKKKSLLDKNCCKTIIELFFLKFVFF